MNTKEILKFSNVSFRKEVKDLSDSQLAKLTEKIIKFKEILFNESNGRFTEKMENELDEEVEDSIVHEETPEEDEV